jgi:hypothetical protein
VARWAQFLLKELRKYLPRETTIVTATTGLAGAFIVCIATRVRMHVRAPVLPSICRFLSVSLPHG